MSDSYELWQSYFLIKEANEGNPKAEHELGIRYLLGQGFPPDTIKSVFWTKKAADQNLPEAQYNLGIFQNNGWGTQWNPFKAYENFQKAAKSKMPEAEYVLGLMLLDNLVVPRNYQKAFSYVKQAADKGYKPAIDVLKEMIKYKMDFGIDSSDVKQINAMKEKTISVSALNPALGINYMDFRQDSLSKPDDITLLKEVLREGSDELKYALGGVAISDTSLLEDMSVIKVIRKAAEAGSPEAQTMLGRCYEKGIGLKKDLVQAAIQYIRAVRLDSRRAPKLLFDLIQKPEFFRKLKVQLDEKKAEARFAYAGLVALRYNFQIPESDALKLLKDASEEKYIPAIIEMGLCYYTGNLTLQDKQKAITIWKQAAALGSSEAKVRIAIANVQDHFPYEDSTESIKVLKEAGDAGSLLAQMALAYCYETGTGVGKNRLEAIHLYRVSTQRGSQGAYRSLKRLYDEIRPKKNEFIVIDDNK
ncbi:MAG TPA: tetratricopeptide repeat protein [Ignavibacteriales bacterium]|nr:tetratricopeptide repeat protein [Ignavibacteriales bacterium]